ncbi:glutathione S-transferase family protein [Luteithermobacter gelatinilyticus]|uniref:glutathione S-transferase family protein n=1 Tax=Luteithermobacter gelatinilyticus TaxID=2582913 RepID=UPI0011070067|nr:glutathione S-transferase family protein [Luteithermobacter gelatinilyticus]|tara:strand:- start:4293 stop:5261 length:969 start_codon:yes stop_codon:yes gene_type:complete
MGLLINGKWVDQWYDTQKTGGRFRREESRFRRQITADGPHPPESGRYHLYVSLACPWAHRTLIFRRLKGLEQHISLSVVHPLMGEEGWSFADGEGVIPDPELNARHLHEIYTAAMPDYTGRVTVPVLWDKQEKTIVNNESAEIIRLFNSAFNTLDGVNELDFYPHPLQADIDALNDMIYPTVNNGVYKAGFATTQDAYEEAVFSLFDTLDQLDRRLADRRYLTGPRLTEADWRLFTTLIRFDAVYVGHFKCNLKRLVDYVHLSAYLRDLYQMPGIAKTVNFDHIKGHYYQSHTTINPTGIVPAGPKLDLDQPHGRNHLEQEM